VASDLLGVTGQNIIKAMIAGETSADRLSWKVRGKLRKKEKEVKQSLAGCFGEFHRAMGEWLRKQYGFLSAQIEEVEARTRREMEPHRELIELLDAVPGIDETVGWTVIAEMGIDMGVFPTAGHVASWAGMCRAPMKAPESRRAPGRGRGTVISGGCCCKRHGQRPTKRIPTCGRSFIACSIGRDGGRRS
jgi:transposase